MKGTAGGLQQPISEQTLVRWFLEIETRLCFLKHFLGPVWTAPPPEGLGQKDPSEEGSAAEEGTSTASGAASAGKLLPLALRPVLLSTLSHQEIVKPPCLHMGLELGDWCF